MRGLLFLLCCRGILSAATTGPYGANESSADETSGTTDQPVTSIDATESDPVTTTALAAVATQPSTVQPTPRPGSIIETLLRSEELFPVLLVICGLIVGCTVLLASTVMLSWKVCHLTERAKALGAAAELISNSDYWMGTARGKGRKSEAQPTESSVLMAHLDRARSEAGKEEANVSQKKEEEEEEEEEEVGDKRDGGDASTPLADGSLSSKPQEAEGATSAGPGEPKEVV